MKKSKAIADVCFKLQADGSYSHFDTSEFTSKSGGKLNAILHIKVIAISNSLLTAWCTTLKISDFPAVLRDEGNA